MLILSTSMPHRFFPDFHGRPGRSAHPGLRQRPSQCVVLAHRRCCSRQGRPTKQGSNKRTSHLAGYHLYQRPSRPRDRVGDAQSSQLELSSHCRLHRVSSIHPSMPPLKFPQLQEGRLGIRPPWNQGGHQRRGTDPNNRFTQTFHSTQWENQHTYHPRRTWRLGTRPRKPQPLNALHTLLGLLEAAAVSSKPAYQVRKDQLSSPLDIARAFCMQVTSSCPLTHPSLSEFSQSWPRSCLRPPS